MRKPKIYEDFLSHDREILEAAMLFRTLFFSMADKGRIHRGKLRNDEAEELLRKNLDSIEKMDTLIKTLAIQFGYSDFPHIEE